MVKGECKLIPSACFHLHSPKLACKGTKFQRREGLTAGCNCVNRHTITLANVSTTPHTFVNVNPFSHLKEYSLAEGEIFFYSYLIVWVLISYHHNPLLQC